MKLRELMPLVFEKLVIYKEVSTGKYEDLYEGSHRNLPEELLSRTVLSVGVRNGVSTALEIEIK